MNDATGTDALLDRIEELEKNINLKSNFIDATINQLAASDQRIEELKAKLAEVKEGLEYWETLAAVAMARAEAAEAALASMQSDALAFVLFLDENYRHSFGDIARKKIRAFYARIQTGEKE